MVNKAEDSGGDVSRDTSAVSESTASSNSVSSSSRTTVSKALEWMHQLPSMCNLTRSSCHCQLVSRKSRKSSNGMQVHIHHSLTLTLNLAKLLNSQSHVMN